MEKTVGQIQGILAQAGAAAIMVEYDAEKILTSVSFQIDYEGSRVSFRLPARLDPVYVILQNDPSIPRRLRSREQAARVAWRIIKNWVEAQLAIIEAEQVEMVEAFLPFAQNPKTGETVFRQLANNNFALLTHDGGP